MNKEVKKLWVEALRSGDYKQGTGYLHMVTESGDDEFCCLGVLCDLAVKAGAISPGEPDDGNRPDLTGYDGTVAFLPVSVQQWSGIRSPDGLFGPRGSGDSLASLNDEGSTFSEIADVIEREF